MPILSYLQGLHEEGECRQLEFWAGKGSNIRDLFCTTPKILNLHGSKFHKIQKYWVKEVPEGGHTPSTRVGARPTPLGAPPALWAPWQPSGAHLLLYEVFRPGKTHKQAHGTKLHRHEAEPWRNQSRAPRSCSARETSLREGEIIAIVITNAPLIRRGQSPSTSSPAPSHLQTLVRLLYPILV